MVVTTIKVSWYAKVNKDCDYDYISMIIMVTWSTKVNKEHNKTPWFHLISWRGNSVEIHSFRIILGG